MKTIDKFDYQKGRMNLSILSYRSTQCVYIEEADDRFLVYSKDSDALKKYIITNNMKIMT